MDEQKYKTALRDLPLGGFRFYETIGSTNDEALAWASSGASDLSIVAADEQTKGRGRLSRRWFTPRSSALAVTTILKPAESECQTIGLYAALGAIALRDALAQIKVSAQIKWPNDVLINRRKVGGVLAESVWAGDRIESIVIGIGVNVLAHAVPPADQIQFPATSLETEQGASLDRSLILRDLITALIVWRKKIASAEFIRAWNESLAFRGERVVIRDDNGNETRGILEGVEADGALRLQTDHDKWMTIHFGEVHLRPAGL
jgi:BirA family biotin operon repressor/biotin-[acetyl-CoA-carboxylase] ligase